MRKFSKILGFITILGALFCFISCDMNPKEEPDNTLFVGSWKSEEYCTIARGLDYFGYGHIYYDFYEDGTFTMKVSIEREENGMIANPVDPIRFFYFLKGDYTYTDTKLIFSNCESSLNNRNWDLESGNLISVYSSLTETSFTAYRENLPKEVHNFTRQ